MTDGLNNVTYMDPIAGRLFAVALYASNLGEMARVTEIAADPTPAMLRELNKINEALQNLEALGDGTAAQIDHLKEGF